MYACRMRNVGVSAMHQMLRLTIVAMAIAFGSFPTSAPAQVAATQIKLTKKHVEGFTTAKKDMSAVVANIQGPVFSNHANATYKTDLRDVPTKHAAKNIAET